MYSIPLDPCLVLHFVLILFNFTTAIPSWIKPDPIYVRNTKVQVKIKNQLYQPLLDVNPQYAYVRLASGIETTINIWDINCHSDGNSQCT